MKVDKYQWIQDVYFSFVCSVRVSPLLKRDSRNFKATEPGVSDNFFLPFFEKNN